MIPEPFPCLSARLQRSRSALVASLSTEEAAARLGVHVETVRRWIRAGRLEPVRVAPKLYRLRSADVDALLAGERTAEPAAPPPERLRAAFQRKRKAGK